ncbi:hypothetical protein [Methyloprofundus sp.]|uniref:hypothetical protein n=1 Tax=Methyloprofundus sp. TaxID=2020875 RepID=UPI003D0D3DF2
MIICLLIEQHIPLLEEISGHWKADIAQDYQGYKHHVYRMVHCCFALHRCSEEEREKIIIAGCFHDLGLWTEHTVDYLPPSVLLARAYLEGNNLQQWTTEIGLMIDMHHKITQYKDDQYPLVEIFRRADLADFSLGLIKGGVSGDTINEVKAAFPNAGFHKLLLKEQGKWLVKHPLNPFPILKF